MLTKSCLGLNFKIFNWMTKVGIVPVNFDPDTGEMIIASSLLRKIVFKFWYSVIVVHSSFTVGCCLYAVLISGEYHLQQLPLMVFYSVALSARVWAVKDFFVKEMELNKKLWDNFCTWESTYNT